MIISASRSAGASETKYGAITEISRHPGMASMTVAARLLPSEPDVLAMRSRRMPAAGMAGYFLVRARNVARCVVP